MLRLVPMKIDLQTSRDIRVTMLLVMVSRTGVLRVVVSLRVVVRIVRLTLLF